MLTIILTGLLYGIAGTLALIGVAAAAFVVFRVIKWFATTEPPEPTYDATVRAPRSYLPGIIVCVILLTWLAANIVQVVSSGRFF